jgi:dienelactone hydrolase
MNDHLIGTQPFPATETVWNHTFRDRYAKQWEAALNWMQRELERLAAERDALRGNTAEWRQERRELLRRLSSAGLFAAETENVRLLPGDNPGSFHYEISLSNGLMFTGSLTIPKQLHPSGVVLLASEFDDSAAELTERDYIRQGYAVIRPFLARQTFSYKDHKQRRWYKYEDHELIQFFSFICGGSLAGLEAFVLHTAVHEVKQLLKRPKLPVIVEASGRHLLPAAVMCALYPGTASVLMLHEQAGRLNRQQDDVRANTIWSFHRSFDALTLFQLAEGTSLMFVEEGNTPSALAAQTIYWFESLEKDGGGARKAMRVQREKAQQALSELLASQAAVDQGQSHYAENGWEAPTVADGEKRTADERYRIYLDSVLALLEKLHEQAAEQKRVRYDIRSIGLDEYKERIRQSLIAVMGEPLPKAHEPNIRTRRVTDNQNGHLNLTVYDLYEVLLESVPGVETAGYLLMPKGSGPFPAVICQHGLTGRPEDVIGFSHKRAAYYRMANLLAEKGYAVYVPFMNWGWGGMPGRDRLAKHAYALGITPNRFEGVQLAAIVDFLQSRKEIIPDRIGFYGLSYGGHASVWLGANEPRLAAVVTSGHFNNWHKKLTSTDAIRPHHAPYSYICVNEGMDMFTYDVLNHLGHAEMTTLHAPRPFMAENRIYDAVAPVPWVEEEFAKVKDAFAQAGAEPNAELDLFNGGHRVWGERSFLFLHKHLQPPK